MKVAVVPADSESPIRVEEVDKINLDFLQKQVAGYIEAIDFMLGGPEDDDPLPSEVSMYLNEEGKLQGLPYNARATFLASEVIMAFDYIAGDVVLTGGVDEEGESTGLTDEQVEALTQPTGAAWFQQ